MVETVLPPRRRRIFIEASFTFSSGLHTGIQRVVRKILEPVMDGTAPRELSDCELIPCFLTDNSVHLLDDTHIRPTHIEAVKEPEVDPVEAFLYRMGSRSAAAFRKVAHNLVPIPSVRRFIHAPRWEKGLSSKVLSALQRVPVPPLYRAFQPPPKPKEPKRVTDIRLLRGVDFVEGDVLILLDSTWHLNFWPMLEGLRAAGVKLVFVVYDLIPMLNQEMVVPGLRDLWVNWIQRTLELADGYMTISKAVADEMQTYLKNFGALPNGRVVSQIPVGWFHLGAELGATAQTGSLSKLRAALTKPVKEAELEAGSFYLMVGTLEPRKRHLMVLEAFEKLWKAGFERKLVFAGTWGWLGEAERKRIETHPEMGKRLIHFFKASDADLQYLYAQSRAVIQASIAEGFGLPVIEAAHHGKRVICTDIPVFREVAAPGTLFFERHSVSDLADTVLRESRIKKGDGPAKPKILTWKESRAQLVERSLKLVENPDPSEKKRRTNAAIRSI